MLVISFRLSVLIVFFWVKYCDVLSVGCFWLGMCDRLVF